MPAGNGHFYTGDALLGQAKAIAIAGAKRAVANHKSGAVTEAMDLIVGDMATDLVPFRKFRGCSYCGTEQARGESIYCSDGCAYLAGFRDARTLTGHDE